MTPWFTSPPWLLPALMLIGGAPESKLLELYERACRVEKYRAPTEEDLRRFAEDLSSSLTLKETTALPNEPPQGRGFFLARGGRSKLFLQAPHARGDDLETDRIALRLIEILEPRAVALSTVSRRLTDLAHETDSYLQEATETFLAQVDGGRILQIHGFSRAKRRTEEGREAEIIVASGQRSATAAARQLAQCLGEQLEVDARVYPDVGELGALRNVQGRATPPGHFLHVELGRDLRRRLAADDRELAVFAGCLPEGWR
ncbi:MAG: hypothetical protein AAF690_29905 [Acidobacteriota bacterium]